MYTVRDESTPILPPADTCVPKSGGGKKRRKAKRGDKGRILLTSLEHEMLCWAQNGFLPAGPMGLVPKSGVCVCVCVHAHIRVISV